MNFIEELKKHFPELREPIRRLHEFGAISEQTAKIGIVQKRMQNRKYRKQDEIRVLADMLCVSERTVQRMTKVGKKHE